MASIKVEIDLLNSGTWTDITTFVDGASIRRGRSDETSTVSPGTLSLDLYNDNGRFTPGLSSGAFYPNITPNRTVRVSTVTTGTVAVFTGKIDAITPSWDGGVRPVATITATDAFKSLQRRACQSFYSETVNSLAPLAYFPLSESIGSTFGNAATGVQLAVAPAVASKYGPGTFTPGGVAAGWLNGAPGDAAATFAHTGTGNTEAMTVVQLPTGGGIPSTSAWSVTLWFNAAVLPPDQGSLFYARGGVTADPVFAATINGFDLYIDPTGHVVAKLISANVLTTTATSAATYTDGKWHCVTAAFHSVSGGGAGTYVDLHVDSTTASASSGLPSTISPTMAGIGGHLSSYGQSGAAFTGSIGQVAIFPADNHAALYAAGRTADTSDTGSNVAALAALAGIPCAADSGNTTSTAVLDIAGSTYLDAMQAWEVTEQGVLFVRGDGTLIFRNRGYRVNQTSAFTLNAANQEVAPDFQAAVDDSLLLNDFAATRPGGAVIRVRDVTTTSVADNGVYTNAATDSSATSILVTTDGEVTDYANYKIGNYSQPQPRTPQITVDLKRAPDLFATIQNVDIGVRFTTINLPAEAPAASIDYIAESVNWTFSGRTDTWTLTMDTSPADTKKYLVLDDPVYGLLDSDNCLFF